MTQKQHDLRTLRALILTVEGGNPGEDMSSLLERATLAFQRLRDEVA